MATKSHSCGTSQRRDLSEGEVNDKELLKTDAGIGIHVACVGNDVTVNEILKRGVDRDVGRV
jgi:hypothetical protein